MKKPIYILLATLVTVACSASGPLRISTIDLTVDSPNDPASAARVELGVIGGQPPYMYQIADEEPQTSNIFDIIAGQEHTFLVSDSAGAQFTTTISQEGASGFSRILVSTAPHSPDQTLGVISIETEGGNPPITNQLMTANGTTILDSIIGNGSFNPIAPAPAYCVRTIPNDDSASATNIILTLEVEVVRNVIYDFYQMFCPKNVA